MVDIVPRKRGNDRLFGHLPSQGRYQTCSNEIFDIGSSPLYIGPLLKLTRAILSNKDQQDFQKAYKLTFSTQAQNIESY